MVSLVFLHFSAYRSKLSVLAALLAESIPFEVHDE